MANPIDHLADEKSKSRKTNNLPKVSQQFISEPGINAGLPALSITYNPV